jgi:hypothetical protein
MIWLLSPPPHPFPVSKLDRWHTRRLRKRDNLLTAKGVRGGGGAKSYDGVKAWSFIKHATLSVESLYSCEENFGSNDDIRGLGCKKRMLTSCAGLLSCITWENHLISTILTYRQRSQPSDTFSTKWPPQWFSFIDDDIYDAIKNDDMEKLWTSRQNSESLTGGFSRLLHRVVDYIPQSGVSYYRC